MIFRYARFASRQRWLLFADVDAAAFAFYAATFSCHVSLYCFAHSAMPCRCCRLRRRLRHCLLPLRALSDAMMTRYGFLDCLRFSAPRCYFLPPMLAAVMRLRLSC